MKLWIVAGLIAVVCLAVYWPHQKAEFVLDDYYTVVRDPLIKNPSLYPFIWTSRLFDAHQSSGYIKFGYYRPVLQSSLMLDYRLFGLKAAGFQWVNLLIHALNCFLIYILWRQLFGPTSLALKACLLFCVLPSHEWVVRYVTGRGDELSALFALVALCLLPRVFKSGPKNGYVLVLAFWALSALTREAAISYILFALLIYYSLPRDSVIPVSSTVIPAKAPPIAGPRPEAVAGIQIQRNINHFSLYWVLIGILPLAVSWHMVPKLGNVQALHLFYFASAGFCLWLAQLRLRWVVVLIALFAAVSYYQGLFWTTEEVLLRHTQSLGWWRHTVFDQQLLMKYDDDVPGIKDMVNESHGPLIKGMWLRRLGIVYFKHGDLSNAQEYFTQSLSEGPSDVDTLDSLAVVCHDKGQEAESLKYLERSLKINPLYPDTLKTLGVYYYIHKDFPQARVYLSRCLFLDPDNIQARELLRLANTTN